VNNKGGDLVDFYYDEDDDEESGAKKDFKRRIPDKNEILTESSTRPSFIL